MKKIYILIIFSLQLLLGISHSFAQMDSLYNEFEKQPKKVQNIPQLIDLTTKIADYNADSALSCAYRIHQIIIPANEPDLTCKVLINLGSITKLTARYEEANRYFNLALKISEEHHLIPAQMVSLYQIGDLNRCIGLLDVSLQYLYLARNLAYKHNLLHDYPQIYDRLSSTFFQLADHNYFRFENVEVPNQSDFPKGKKTPQDFIKLCKTYADSTIVYSALNNNIRTHLSGLNLLGAYFRQEKKYNEAIEYFNKALELSMKYNFRTDAPNSYANIAKTYYELKNYHKAIEYALKGYEIADKLNIVAYKTTLAYVLSISYIEIKDFEHALEYQIAATETRNIIYSQENWNKITELDKKYQSEKKQKEIEHQQEMLALKNSEVFRLYIIIVIMLIVVVVIVIGIILIQRQKRKINQQAEKITEQYQNLEKLDHFKETLTHTLVHDLKNPLSQILINTDNPNIRFASNKMLRLIMNLLDVEKHETAQFILNKENHSLTEIIQELEKEHNIALSEKNIQLKQHFNDFEIVADKEVISRVFDNLLTNAIRFSPLNNTIDIFAEKADDNSIRITVKNYGQIIPDNELPYIFDKYRHFGKNNNPSYRSTGLGLTFCKMAIEAHGQQIKVENHHKGVQFSFTIEGKTSNQLKPLQTPKVPETIFSQEEKELLKPFALKLKEIEVFQISDVMHIVSQIPDLSQNIIQLKNQISNAAFATNEALYNKLIQKISV